MASRRSPAPTYSIMVAHPTYSIMVAHPTYSIMVAHPTYSNIFCYGRQRGYGEDAIAS